MSANQTMTALLTQYNSTIRTFVLTGGPGDVLATANSRRWGIIFSNVSGVQITISTDPSVTTTTGLRIPNGASPFMITNRDFPSLPQLAWFGSGGIADIITVVELVRL